MFVQRIDESPSGSQGSCGSFAVAKQVKRLLAQKPGRLLSSELVRETLNPFRTNYTHVFGDRLLEVNVICLFPVVK